ncbi:MAG: FeoA domain protein [Planctomycetes bacterium ADurb.Bin401]|nr:MAG: FeoA domain protein [Planctomycetes bacterium ADurb.Bin401]
MGHERIFLKDAGNEKSVRLLKIEAGQALKARLAAMGLLPGTQFRIINNGHPGPFVIDLKGSRIVLGRGMAGKVVVKPLESQGV